MSSWRERGFPNSHRRILRLQRFTPNSPGFDISLMFVRHAQSVLSFAARDSAIDTSRLLCYLRGMTAAEDAYHSGSATQRQDKENSCWPYAIGAAVFCLLFGAYLYTAFPGIGPRDSAELASIPSLKLLHAPGYPLAVIVGKALATLPVGNPAYRINLLSVLFAALSTTLLYFALFNTASVAFRSTDERLLAIAAALPMLLFGFSLPIWRQSVVAEVFMLNLFFASLLILVLSVTELTDLHKFLLVSLLMGLALCDHQTIVFMLPAIFLDRLAHLRRITPREKILSMAIFAVGLLPYPAIFFLHKSIFSLDAWIGLMRMFLRMEYGTFRLTGPFTIQAAAAGGHTGIFLGMTTELVKRILQTYGYAGVPLAIFGFLRLRIARERLAVGLLCSLIFSGPVFIMMGKIVPDARGIAMFERFFLLPNLLCSFFFGFGFLSLTDYLWNKRKPLSFALLALAAMLSATRSVANNSRASGRESFLVGDLLRSISMLAKQKSVFMVRGDTEVFGLEYLRQTKRPDITVVQIPVTVDSSGAEVTENTVATPPPSYLQGGSIYTQPNLVDLFIPSELVGVVPEGPLIRFQTNGPIHVGPDLTLFQYVIAVRGLIPSSFTNDFFMEEVLDLFAHGMKRTADSLLRRKDFAQAEIAYRSIPLMHDYSDSYRELAFGLIHLENAKLSSHALPKMDNIDEAISILSGITPASEDVHFMLATAFYVRKNYHESLSQCSQMADADYRRHNVAGTVYAQLGDLPRAAAEFAQALQLKPDAASIRMNYEIVTRMLRHK